MIGVLYALTDTVNLYASAGRGRDADLRRAPPTPDGLPGLNFALEPSRSTNYEAGIKMLLWRATRLNLAVFRTAHPQRHRAGRQRWRPH